MILPDYIAARLTTPFEWGVHDCVTFTIGWVEIAAGRQYLPDPLWSNEFEANSQVMAQGGLIEVFGRRFKRIEPNYARDGDLCIADGVAALFSGPYLVQPGKDGLIFKKRTEAEHAWTY